MICPKCNNSIGDSECICGNCGYNVRDDVDVALMQCISISGKDIYNNSNKFNALIADLLPKNEKERNALSNALKANVSIYIFNHNNASVDEIISNTLGEVCELTFTEPAWARYAIIKLSKAMGIFIPEEYDSTLDPFSIQDEGSKSLQWDYKKEEYSEFEKYSTSELESMLDKQENAYIEYELGGRYKSGIGCKENAAKAFTYFESSAVKGFALSQFVLGTYFDVGYGCEPDKDMAIWWYEQAAEQDLPEALCALAGEYFEGENVGRDENKAIDLYERAADLGNEDAKLCLSSIYLEKCNNEDDIKRAIEYLKEAAESGNGEACNSLGIVFEMGKGVPKDDREAIK